jgi:hypothetical protein
LVTGGVKAEPPKFANLCKNWAAQKNQERCQGACVASKSLPPMQFGANTQNFQGKFQDYVV